MSVIEVSNHLLDLDNLQSTYINCDCMEGMTAFPDKYFDIAIVDPPYGRKEHGGRNRAGWAKQKNGTRLYVSGGNQYENRGWDNKPAGKEYFDELMRVSKNQIIWGCNYFDYPLVGGRIIWDKCNDGSDQSGGEIAYNSLNKRVDIFRYMWRGMFQGKSITEGTIQQGNKKLNEKRISPTQKPVILYRWLVQQYVQPGWKILDTHTGSASSLIAYHEAGNPFVAFEIDDYMYNLSKERFERETAQMSLSEYLGANTV